MSSVTALLLIVGWHALCRYAGIIIERSFGEFVLATFGGAVVLSAIPFWLGLTP